MLDINVKTIDGQNRSYSVPDNYTVKQFKEKIAHSLSIPVDRQRLIFQGRELKDNSALNEYDVNGKTLHLVQRIPPTHPAANANPQNEENSSNRSGPNAPQGFNQDVQQIINQLIGGLGEFGQNATFNTTTNADTNGMEVHIDLGNVSQLVNENEIRSRIRNIRRFLSMTQSRLNRIQEIQSGAPLNDVPHSTIIVGSIQTTASISDPSATGNDPAQRIITTSIPFSSVLSGATPGLNNLLSSMTSNTPPTPTTSNNNTPPTNESATNEPAPNPTASNQQESLSVQVLAELTQSVMDAYASFLPHLRQYQEMLVNDEVETPEQPASGTPTGAEEAPPAGSDSLPTTNNPNVIVLGDNRRQRFFNNINDMMHLLGHLFHNLSDLHVNIRDRPPRQVHTMSSIQHSTSAIISAVPLEASIQIPFSVPSTAPNATNANANTNANRNTNANPTTTTTTSTSTTSTTTTTTANGTTTTSSRTTNSTERPPWAANHPLFSMPNIGVRPPMPNLNNMRSFGPRLIRPPIPVPPAFPISAHNSSYDQYLPCNSVHFYNSANPILQQHQNANPLTTSLLSSLLPNLNQTQRRRHPAGDQPTPAPSSQPRRNDNPIDTHSSADLSRLLNSMLSSSVRSALNPENSTSTSRPAPNTNTPADSSPFGALQNILNAALGTQNDSALNQPMSEILRNFSLGDESQSDELPESSPLNVFNVFLTSLTLSDIVDLARGQNRHRIFERARQPLRAFLREKFSIQTESDESIASFVDQLYHDLFEDQNSGLHIDFEQFQLVDAKLDFKKSFTKLIKAHFRTIIKHILNPIYDEQTERETSSTWSSVLCEQLFKLADNLVNLVRACVRDPDQTLMQLVLRKFRENVLSQNVLAGLGFFGMFESFIQSQVQTLLGSISTNRASIEEFIVRKEEERVSVSSDDDNKSVDQFDSASSTLSGHSLDVEQHFIEAQAQAQAQTSSSLAPLAVFPDEWIPVIERDMEKMQNSSLNSSISYSDAYVNGMPAKKRKVILSRSDLVTKSLFKRVLGRTLDQIQLKANVNEEQVLHDGLNQSKLVDEFDGEFDLVVTERLKQDKDYNRIKQDDEMRFQNTRKRFSK